MYYQILIINAGKFHYFNVNGDNYLYRIEKLLNTKKYDIFFLNKEVHTIVTKYRFYVPVDQQFSLKDSLEMKDLTNIPIVVACFDFHDKIKDFDGHLTKIFSQRPDIHERPISEWLYSLGCQKENQAHMDTDTQVQSGTKNLSPNVLKKRQLISPPINQFGTITSI